MSFSSLIHLHPRNFYASTTFVSNMSFIHFLHIFSFLDVTSQLYKKLCPSVRPPARPSARPSTRPSARPSVRPSVRMSIRNAISVSDPLQSHLLPSIRPCYLSAYNPRPKKKFTISLAWHGLALVDFWIRPSISLRGCACLSVCRSVA